MIELLLLEMRKIRGVTNVEIARTFNFNNDDGKIISLNYKGNIHGVYINETPRQGGAYMEYRVAFYKGIKQMKDVSFLQVSHTYGQVIELIIIALKNVLHGL